MSEENAHSHDTSSKWASRKLWFAAGLEVLLAVLVTCKFIETEPWLKGTVYIAGLYLVGQGIEDSSKRFRPFSRS